MKKKIIIYFLILCAIMLILSGCTKKDENNKTEDINNKNPEISRISIDKNINNEQADDTTNSTRKRL